MNTNGRFPKCLFKSFSEVFVASFCFTYRYCYLKLPVVAKTDKTRMTYPISVRMCVIFFFFSVSTCFSSGLVSGLPGNHDCACLLYSCFQVQPRYLVFSHEYIICWLLVYTGGLLVFPSFLPTCHLDLFDWPKTLSSGIMLSIYLQRLP